MRRASRFRRIALQATLLAFLIIVVADIWHEAVQQSRMRELIRIRVQIEHTLDNGDASGFDVLLKSLGPDVGEATARTILEGHVLDSVDFGRNTEEIRSWIVTHRHALVFDQGHAKFKLDVSGYLPRK